VALFSSPAGYILRRYLGPLFMYGLIRQQEFQADKVGIQYHVNAEYDSLEFLRLLQTVVPEDEDDETFVERLSDTHPSSRARIKRLKSIARQSDWSRASYLVNTSEFQDMKTRLAILKARQ